MDLQAPLDDLEVFDPEAAARDRERAAQHPLPEVGTASAARTRRHGGAAPAAPLDVESPDESLLETAIEGAAQPSQRELERQERADKHRIRFYRDPELLAEDTGDRGEPLLLLFAACLAGALVFVGWLAWGNDGVVDFTDVRQSIERALEGPATLPADETSLAPPESTQQSPPATPQLAVADVRQTLHRNNEGQPFALIDGMIHHREGAPVRRVELSVTLRGADGSELGVMQVPAGALIDDNTLDFVRSEDAMDEALRSLRNRSAALRIESGQRTPFRAAFALQQPTRPSQLSTDVDLVSFEQERSAICWERVDGATDEEEVEEVEEAPDAQ